MGNYKKIDKDDILYIKNTIQDDERVLVGENINEEYSHDELSGTSSYPDVVVKAKSAEEIAAIMKYAYKNRGAPERVWLVLRFRWNMAS